MQAVRWLYVGGVATLLLFACTPVEDDGLGDEVFSCDARSITGTCQEESATALTKEASKGTCQDIKGSWSDSRRCPSGYAQKCKDGKLRQYFYGNEFKDKECSQLVFAPWAMPEQERWAMSFAALPLP